MKFVDRVLTHLKGGDESKILKFKEYVEKFLTKQIKEAKEGISEFKDKLKDKNDELYEIVVHVHLDRIKDTDSRKNYVPKYLNAIEAKQEEIEIIKEEIEELEETIKVREFELGLIAD